MFQPIGSLFSRQPAQWEEVDIKYLVQDWLRAQLKNESVYCDEVKKGAARVRVGSPALQQAVQLAEYDLIEYLEDKAGYELERVVVRVGG